MIDPREVKDTEISYQGTELELFADAVNWKTYWSKCLSQYAIGTVIEVGAGIGSSTRYICAQSGIDRCICLEPDPNFAVHLSNLVSTGRLPSYCEIRCGILSDLPSTVQADAIFYVDVLEHIDNDLEEVANAAMHLIPGGRIVVLSPAFR